MAGSLDEKTFAFEQSVFSGGANSVSDPRIIPDGQYALGTNAYPGRDGRIHKRPGYVLVNDAIEGLRASCWLVNEAGSYILIVWYGDKVGYVDADGDLHELNDGLDTEHGIAHEAWGEKVYYSDGANGLDAITFPSLDVAARVTIEDGGKAKLVVDAVAAGTGGNDISIVIADNDDGEVAYDGYGPPFFASNPEPDWSTYTPIVVDVVDSTITITLGTALTTGHVITHPGGVGMQTEQVYDNRYRSAKAIKAAIEASTEASALVKCSLSGATPENITTDPGGLPVGTYAMTGGVTAGEVKFGNVYQGRSFVALCARDASERLFGVEAADPTNLRWCANFDATKWADGDVASPGGNLIALADTGDEIVMWTKDCLYRITGTDPKTWQMKKVKSNGLGCVSAATVQVIEGIPVYQSPRGIAYFDGTSPKLLSDDVCDLQQPGKSLVPTDGTGTFALQTGDHYMLFFGGNKAIVHDFRMRAWGGPYEFAFTPIAGTSNTAHPALVRPLLITDDSKLVREDLAVFTDLGEVYEMYGHLKTIDGARPSRDKVFIDSALGIIASGAGEIMFGILCDGETGLRDRAYATKAFVAGDNLLRNRLPNVRAKTAIPFFDCSCDCDVAVYVEGVDLFFPRPR